jgi:hypothetical protein
MGSTKPWPPGVYPRFLAASIAIRTIRTTPQGSLPFEGRVTCWGHEPPCGRSAVPAGIRVVRQGHQTPSTRTSGKYRAIRVKSPTSLV